MIGQFLWSFIPAYLLTIIVGSLIIGIFKLEDPLLFTWIAIAVACQRWSSTFIHDQVRLMTLKEKSLSILSALVLSKLIFWALLLMLSGGHNLVVVLLATWTGLEDLQTLGSFAGRLALEALLAYASLSFLAKTLLKRRERFLARQQVPEP